MGVHIHIKCPGLREFHIIAVSYTHLDVYKRQELNSANRQHAVITDTEVMGNENNLYFTFGGTQAVARVSKYEISQIGDKIEFVLMPSKMHFFDRETGINYTEA